MAEPAPQTAEAPEDPPPVPLSVALPVLVTALEPGAVLARLEALARRGKLAGFTSGSAQGPGPLFTADAFGTPFDGRLACAASRREGATRLTFTPALKPLMPWVFVMVMIASVWPGVVLTESLVASLFPGSSAWRYTWWWYMPLTVPFVPWGIYSAFRKSRAAVHDSAHRAIAKIAAEIGAKPEEAGSRA